MTGRGYESGTARAWLARLTGPQRGLAGVAAALAAGCLWLAATWGGPVSVARTTLPLPAGPPELAEEPVPESPFAYDPIVENDLFSPDRRPPARPWSEITEAGGGESEPPTAAGPPPHASYRLHGTVLTGSRETEFALIEADPERERPERYRVGDRVGPYRLRRIEPDRVVLSGGIELPLVVERRSAEAAAIGGP